MEKEEKFQYFSVEKSALSGAVEQIYVKKKKGENEILYCAEGDK